jgi:hypothetical protein
MAWGSRPGTSARTEQGGMDLMMHEGGAEHG